MRENDVNLCADNHFLKFETWSASPLIIHKDGVGERQIRTSDE